MSQGFVSSTLMALGPYIAPVLVLVFYALLALAIWLIDTGIERRIWWRVVAGLPIAVYLMAVVASFVFLVA